MSHRRPSRRDYPRHVRIAEEVRKAVAAEIERLDEIRLVGVAVTGAELDRELRHGVVFVDAMSADVAQAESALADHRVKLQQAVARRARLRYTPVLEFRLDQAIESASRIEEILSGLDIPPGDEAEEQAGEESAEPADGTT